MTIWSPNFIGDEQNLVIIQWGPGAKFGDTFVSTSRGDLVDRSIQVEGTFGASTVVNIQGSNDAISNSTGNYHNLHDPFGNVITLTGAGIVQVIEVTAWMQPVISAGTGTESLTITVCSRRSFR